jgi:hypothetical protein
MNRHKDHIVDANKMVELRSSNKTPSLCKIKVDVEEDYVSIFFAIIQAILLAGMTVSNILTWVN